MGPLRRWHESDFMSQSGYTDFLNSIFYSKHTAETSAINLSDQSLHACNAMTVSFTVVIHWFWLNPGARTEERCTCTIMYIH